jgi:hypothetical protein
MARGVVFGMVRAPKGVKSYSEVVDVSAARYTAPDGRKSSVMYRGRDAVVVARVGTRGGIKGGVVTVRYKGKTIGRAKVPASGLARVRIDTSGLVLSSREKRHNNDVSVRFEGTATAKRSLPVNLRIRVFPAP